MISQVVMAPAEAAGGQGWVDFTLANLDAVAMMAGAGVLFLVAIVLAVGRFGHPRHGNGPSEREVLRLR